jgi:hypothetical protein
VDYQFVHSAKLVGVYCVVLKPLQIGRNQELLRWRLFGDGEVNIFGVYIQSEH